MHEKADHSYQRPWALVAIFEEMIPKSQILYSKLSPTWILQKNLKLNVIEFSSWLFGFLAVGGKPMKLIGTSV